MKLERIHNTNSITKPNKNFKGGREIIRTLANPDALASVIVLESFVTGGRSINAYKRGGFAEFRERFTDDLVSAIFWMKGVDIFNKLGNKFGEKVLKLPVTNFDQGKDALRTPVKNVIADIGKDLQDPAAIKAVEKKLAAFKLTKTICATLLATSFVGFILPKINQGITKHLFAKNKGTEGGSKNQQPAMTPYGSMNDFENELDNKHTTAFKGISADTLFRVAHNLENKKICKMLSCDVGITSGRVITARNKDEGFEYLFRDLTSLFFYFASTPLIYKGLQKVSKSTKATNIDPVAANGITEKLIETLKTQNGTFKTADTKEFAKKTLGVLDDKAKEVIENLPFNSDVISLKELSSRIKDAKLLERAAEMAKLQPQQAGIGSVLTKQQVQDVFKNTAITNPEFMQKLYTSKFGENLTNPYKYIPMKQITGFRDKTEEFIQSVISYAEKTNNGVVNKEMLEKFNKMSFIKSAAFRIFAIAVSAFALGFAIPKIQYAITKKRTGSGEAPGLREYKKS